VDIAKVVVNDVGTTEEQLENEEGLPDRMQQATTPCSPHQEATGSPVHDGGIVQGLADGHVAVIGHHCQQKDLSATKEMQEKYLCDAALEGNHFPPGQRVKDELGGCNRTIIDLHQGQVAEEEVHGADEPFTSHDGHHNEAIAQHNGCVHE
jgi:hypothetical protein